MQSKAAEVIARCRELAEITDVPGETTRPSLSSASKDAHRLLTEWMCAAGLEVHTDDAGNLRGMRPTRVVDAPTLLLFSHIDTVPNAGAFDGPLGVILGLASIELLGESPLPFSIELLAFSEEEGVRFAVPFFGSRAVVGQISSSDLACRDREGVTIAGAIRAFGLDPSRIVSTCPLPVKSFAALEVHIEQGPVLENKNRSLGIVDAIAGQSRLKFTFEGRANHAGTTPMGLRRDALAAAARWISEVEDYASRRAPLVATVGSIEALPGATNVVPGLVHLTLDIRHPDDVARQSAVAILAEKAEAVGAQREVSVHIVLQSEQATVPMDSKLTQTLRQASLQSGHQPWTMFSGAGHDAMILAPHVPTTMLFVRSPGGLSHQPAETVREMDVEAALATVLTFIEQITPP